MISILKMIAVSAALLAGSCTALGPKQTVGDHSRTITHRMSSEFTFKTVDSLLNALQEAEKKLGPKDTFEVILTSPGGLVSAFKTLLHRMSLSPLHIRTVVHTGAYSAGAYTFILGDERVMEEDAEIMFHYARFSVRGQTITATVLRDYFKNRDLIERKKNMCLKIGAKQICRDVRSPIEKALGEFPDSTLKKWLKGLTKINNFMYQVVETRLGKEIADKVLIDGKDIYLTAKEALELGIATRTYKIQTERLAKVPSNAK